MPKGKFWRKEQVIWLLRLFLFHRREKREERREKREERREKTGGEKRENRKREDGKRENRKRENGKICQCLRDSHRLRLYLPVTNIGF
jgi:squalene cyclase